MTRWSEDEEQWLRRRYAAGTIEDTIAAFERKFGRRPSKQSLFVKANKLGLHKTKRQAPRRAVKKIRWSCEPKLNAWMLEHDHGQKVDLLSAEFKEAFGFPLSYPQITLWRSSNGKNVRSPHYKVERVPVGTIRDTGKGYMLIKVADFAKRSASKDNWRPLHHVRWEEYHGRPIPEGYTVMYGDRDCTNLAEENLVLAPKKVIGVLNNPAMPTWTNAEELEACIAYAELNMAINDARYRVPRKCGVCGRTFSPYAEGKIPRSSYKTALARLQTCSSCREQGKKSRGARTKKGERICAVCGRKFNPLQKNQVRCQECIDRRPKYAASKQRELEEKGA